MLIRNNAPNPLWLGKVLIAAGTTSEVESEDYGRLVEASKAQGPQADGFSVSAKWWIEHGLEVIKAPATKKKKKEKAVEGE